MANPWRLLTLDVQEGLRNPLVDPEVYSSHTGNNRRFVPKSIPGARAFGDWYDEYYRKPVGVPVDEKSVFAEWRFNHALTAEQRNSLLCVHAKLRTEKLWGEVETVNWVGSTGEILFVPKQPPDHLKATLGRQGYGDWWLPAGASKWGMRSRFRGVQLHFRGPTADQSHLVNVHIDINHPGDPTAPGAQPTGWREEFVQALSHFSEDNLKRKTTHTVAQLRTALAGCGIAVPSVP